MLNKSCRYAGESPLKMKQQTHDKLNVWRTRKKSEPQMGFEPTTLRDLVETHKLTLAHHRVSSSSVVRASD